MATVATADIAKISSGGPGVGDLWSLQTAELDGAVDATFFDTEYCLGVFGVNDVLIMQLEVGGTEVFQLGVITSNDGTNITWSKSILTMTPVV